MKRTTMVLAGALIGLAAGCAEDSDARAGTHEPAVAMDHVSLSDVEPRRWEALASRRVFFGHRSVGRNIMDGVRTVVEAHPELELNLVTGDPSEVPGPAFIDAELGENRHPETKDDAFARVLASGFGDEDGAVAMYKYCYVDMQPDTDPEELFRTYVEGIEELRDRFPGVTVVHFTVPLHQAPTGWLDRMKTRLGRTTQIALNAKRHRYNELLRERYGGSEPLFDLAAIESRRPDGSLAYTQYRGDTIPMLAPEYTYDGGHLNDAAREYVAERLLVFLAHLEAPARATGP